QMSAGWWCVVLGSRDPGLHGRLPVFSTPRALVRSYVDTYVDYTGGVSAVAVADMRGVTGCNWLFAKRSVGRAEQYLLDSPPHKLPTSRARVDRLRARY